jgi:large subunit ribosomal protein L29
MKSKEIRELSAQELRKRSGALRKELVLMRLQNASGALENTARIGHVSRDIARIETILSERSRTAAQKA